jgi:hypothetical protein
MFTFPYFIDYANNASAGLLARHLGNVLDGDIKRL